MSYGQLAYEAYARSTGGKTHDGRDMPAWADLGEHVQNAWHAASEAVLRKAAALVLGRDES